MIFYSLNDSTLRATLKQATLTPTAADGGLYFPVNVPRIPAAMFRHLADFSLHDIGYIVANMMFSDDIDSETIQTIVNDSLSFDIPLCQVSSNVWSLELFHGPSKSFKDIGARFLARLLTYFHGTNVDNPINLLVATAGPAVEAIVKAFGNIDGTRVFILYPAGRRNRIEFVNLSRDTSNIIPTEVDGTFDDCNSIIHRALTDTDLTSKIALSSANSLNIARLLPQTIYYFRAYAELLRNGVQPESLYISVPSGNFGNLSAGVIAKKMGLPVKGFIAAENINCPFNRYLNDGKIESIPTIPTLAGALDVGSPNNLPRLQHLYNGSVDEMRREIISAVIDDDKIIESIRQLYTDSGYLLDPHSAVAYRALIDNIPDESNGIFLSTASPEKSRRLLTHIIGVDPFSSTDIRQSASEIRPARINATYPALKKFLLTQ